MRYPILVLAACAFGLSARALAIEMINLPVMDPPKSDSREGEFVFKLLPRTLQRNPEFEMSINCILTPYGRTIPSPTPQLPAYYVIHDAGRQQLGETMDREIPPETLDKFLTRALSTNGYLPATDPSHRPSLVLIYRWGSSYALDIETQLQFPLLHYHQRKERAQLIGESSFHRQYTGSSADVTAYYHEENSLFFVVVSAYDYDSVARGERKLVWRTHLTANAQGVAMREAMPALVLTAGTSFGRNTGGAQFVTRRAVRGRVELAPLIIVQSDVAAPRPANSK